MIDWKSKLASRKFWALVAAFAIGAVVMFHGDGELADEIGGMIMTFGAVVVYILSEAKIDAERIKHSITEDIPY